MTDAEIENELDSLSAEPITQEKLSRMLGKIKKFASDGLIQVHWQKLNEPSKTEMVAQGGDFKTSEEMYAWIREVVDRRNGECSR